MCPWTPWASSSAGYTCLLALTPRCCLAGSLVGRSSSASYPGSPHLFLLESPFFSLSSFSAWVITFLPVALNSIYMLMTHPFVLSASLTPKLQTQIGGCSVPSCRSLINLSRSHSVSRSPHSANLAPSLGAPFSWLLRSKTLCNARSLPLPPCLLPVHQEMCWLPSQKTFANQSQLSISPETFLHQDLTLRTAGLEDRSLCLCLRRLPLRSPLKVKAFMPF